MHTLVAIVLTNACPHQAHFLLSRPTRPYLEGHALVGRPILSKAPIPLKIKIFVWQLLWDRLPSGVEVAKRNGSGNGLYPLCPVPEDTLHIMFTCPVA
jgi:hypothetical protein